MMRLMLILMVATGVCACKPMQSGMANRSGDTRNGVGYCPVPCGNSLTESGALALVQYDLDAVVRSAPF
jgi:hypothetical protein